MRFAAAAALSATLSATLSGTLSASALFGMCDQARGEDSASTRMQPPRCHTLSALFGVAIAAAIAIFDTDFGTAHTLSALVGTAILGITRIIAVCTPADLKCVNAIYI